MPALTAAELEALGVAREVAANARMTAAGFVGNAAAYERDANQRSIAAGFTSAVDQEIDANRRARLAGFKNAALQENPAAAAPGESIYSTDPFIDPRSAVASANNLSSQNWVRPSGGGLLNYAVPSFRSPAYEDWTRFMPTDFQLAEFGGMHYQPGRRLGILPSDTSTTGTSGVGTRYTPTYTPTTTTTTTPGGTKYPGVKTGSDKEKDLDAGRTHHVEMYDANDAWVGAEGTPMGDETRDLLGATQDSTGRITANARPSSYAYESRLDAMPEMTTPQASAAQAANAMSGFQNVGYLGNSPGYFSPIDAQTQASVDQLGRVNVLSDQQEAMRALTARQTAQRFQDAMPTQGIQAAQAAAMANSMAAKGLYDPMNDYQDEMARQALTSYSMGPNYGALSGSARIGAGGVSDINAQINAAQKANEIAAAQARWGSMDDSTQRTMMASAGKPDMGAMLEAMAQQQALANLSAAGGMEFGGLLGMPEIETNVDVGGTRGSRTGGFGKE